jgi:hypothetical protein
LEILKASQQSVSSKVPGGGLVAIEQLLSDNHSDPFPASLASVSMLLGD